MSGSLLTPQYGQYAFNLQGGGDAVLNLDGRVIGKGSRGPVTEKLQAMYFDLVHGRSPLHPEWLTPVK